MAWYSTLNTRSYKLCTRVYNARDVHVFEDRVVPNTVTPPHCWGWGVGGAATDRKTQSSFSPLGKGKGKEMTLSTVPK